MNRTLATLVVAITLLGAASCCCCWGGSFDWERFFEPTLTFGDPDTPIPEPTPAITREPPGDAGAETERLLETTEVPVADIHELAIRLQGLPPDTPRTANSGGPPDYPVGERRLFHVGNVDTDERFDIYATMEYKTEHVYMWIEEGVRLDRDDLIAAADFFEADIYPTNHAFFGSEWSPGVDNDTHISILHAHNQGTSYYSMVDEFVTAVREDSNEMEMFYIDLDHWTINKSDYHATLAHEFQHMIHWYSDRNEGTWMNEGFAELASFLNGFDPSTDYAFARLPDTQLTDIDYDAPDGAASYGAGYLFTSYFLDRFGPDATQALVGHPENGLTSVDAVLTDLGLAITHEDLFGDWVVANMLDDTGIDDGRYGYEEIDPPSFRIETSYGEADYPVSQSSTVRQYGTDYLELSGEQPLTLRFTGSLQVGLLNNTAHSGKYVWWSNRSDESDMMLTRKFDLSNVTGATLEFWAWYDIEEDWDYTYVEVSTDGGKTWKILPTTSGTDTDPNGNSFGWGYTGKSGGGEMPEWIQEQVDLSPYAGQELAIRFEQICDGAVNRPGFVLDDIAIPEIDYFSDLEEDGGGWETAGFVRHANVLPQRWLVQMILFGPDTMVERLDLDEDGTGEWVIPLGGRADRAILAVSGLAPVTTEWASYNYEIREQQ